MLEKYVDDPSHLNIPQRVQVQEDLSYEERPVENLDREVHKLKNNKEIVLVKVLWHSRRVEETIWESEDNM